MTPRVFHITSKPPFPIVDGGCFASARLLHDLRNSEMEIIHLSLITSKHTSSKEQYPEWIKTIHFFSVDTRIKTIPALSASLRGRSYNVERFECQELLSFLSNNLKRGDTVIIDGLFASTFLEQLRIDGIKFILRAHNLEFKIWEELGQSKQKLQVKFGIQTNRSLKDYLKRWYYRHLAQNLKKYETRVYSEVDEVWAISETDAATISGLIDRNVSVVPVSLPKNEISRNYTNNSMFHIGGSEWLPNSESIEICRILHQRLIDEGYDIELHLIGSGIESAKRTSEVVHGFVKELNALISNLGFLCAPIVSGSGIRIKILEAMSQGIPVITTSKGSQGIIETSSIIIAENSAEFLDAIRTLSSSEELRKELGSRSHSTIEKYHSESGVEAKIRSLLNG